jgi:hypothetical protein
LNEWKQNELNHFCQLNRSFIPHQYTWHPKNSSGGPKFWKPIFFVLNPVLTDTEIEWMKTEWAESFLSPEPMLAQTIWIGTVYLFPSLATVKT